MDDSELPLESFQSIQELFTRKLKEDARPMALVHLVSPADGILSTPTWAKGGLRIKGRHYSLSHLAYGKAINSEKPAKDLSVDHFASFLIYLAPHNYHRIHAPCDFGLEKLIHVKGTLWPVNPRLVHWLPQIFWENERLTFEGKLATGEKILITMIGALNVGRLFTKFAPFFVEESRQTKSEKISTYRFGKSLSIKKGEEIGIFQLGSTVVVAYDHSAEKIFGTICEPSSREVLVGEALVNS